MKPRNILIKALRWSGLPWLVRALVQRRKVSIVMFHDIAPDHAIHVFSWLAERYNIIRLNDYLEARRLGDKRKLPPKSLIITLDDGHRRNRELLPVLQSLQLPVTIFLCAGIVGTRRHFWFLHRHPKIDKEALKKIPNDHRLARLAETGFDPLLDYDTPQALDHQHVLDMKSTVDFQSHSMLHPCLHTCSNAVAREEIAGSKSILEETYGLDIRSFAFPNGDYSDRDLELLREAGYECAVTVDFGYNTLHTDPFRLKRLSIDDNDDLDAVCVKSSGIWTFLLALAGKRRWNGRQPLVIPD